MVKILVESNGRSEVAMEGNVVQCLAELGAGIEHLIGQFIDDCPKACREMTKDLIKDTLNFAVDEAFKK